MLTLGLCKQSCVVFEVIELLHNLSVAVFIIAFSTMSVRTSQIDEAKFSAAVARDSITMKVGSKYFPKVCCICDQFILYGDEERINVNVFKQQRLRTMLGKNKEDLMVDHDLTEESAANIMKYYVPRCLKESHSELRELYLSPRSYYVNIGNRKNNGFGCCRTCKAALRDTKERRNKVG